MNVEILKQAGLAQVQVDEARCALPDADAELFFGPDGELAAQKNPREAIAIARYCAWCAIKETCLEASIETKQYYGVWGGEGERKRRDEIRKRFPSTSREEISARKPKAA